MEKKYLAGFGYPPRSDTLSNCKGYFLALKEEGTLRGKINSGWIVTVGGECFDIFCKLYGNDALLWEMLSGKVEKEKKNSLSISVTRAEINEGVGKTRINSGLVGLNRNFPSFDFFIYSSDIDTKS